MDFSDWFDFNNRVKKDMVLVKEVNGQLITKQVRGSFNWLAWIFNLLFIFLTQKYKTQGFIQKALIPWLAILIADTIVTLTLGQLIGSIFGLAISIWYGFMFDTWFKNQLIANGYHVDSTITAESINNRHDFE